MIRNMTVAVVGAACLGLTMGCGKAPPPPIVAAEGIVLLDGKPLNKAVVQFLPMIDYGPEYTAVGVTDESGRFHLTCKGKPGACACENRVTVAESEIPSELQSENAQVELARYFMSLGGRPLPQKYANLVDSPLAADVKAGKTEYAFNLTR